MANNIITRSVSCEKEKQQAIKLIHHTFFKNSQSFEQTWNDLNNKFKSDHVIGAFFQDEIQGCCILSPTDYFRDTRKIVLCFLTYVCVCAANQNIGIGRKLISYAIEKSRVLKYNSIITIARKSADRYYTKFGFTGASVYPLLEIKGAYAKASSTLKVIETEFKNKRISEYEIMRKNTFLNLGYFARDKYSWMSIKKNIIGQRMKILEFHDKNLIGYAILMNDIIIEIALANIKVADQIINSLLLQNKIPLKMQINHLHPIIHNFHLYDITYKMRNCPYGGHMILPLSEKKQSRGRDILKNFKNMAYFYVPQLDEK